MVKMTKYSWEMHDMDEEPLCNTTQIWVILRSLNFLQSFFQVPQREIGIAIRHSFCWIRIPLALALQSGMERNHLRKIKYVWLTKGFCIWAHFTCSYVTYACVHSIWSIALLFWLTHDLPSHDLMTFSCHDISSTQREHILHQSSISWDKPHLK